MRIFAFMSFLLTINLLTLRAATPTISREDLKKTLVHVQQLAHELQSDLDAATVAKLALGAQLTAAEQHLVDAQKRADDLQGQINMQAALLEAARQEAALEKDRANKEAARADREHAIAQENARERDVFVWFFAGALALAITFAVGPHLAKIMTLNPLWSLGAYVALFLLSLGGAYALIRIILTRIVHAL